MKTILFALSGASVLAALLLGCKAKEDVPTQSKQHSTTHQVRPTIASKEELQRLLPLGMGTNEIVLALGEPHSVDNMSNGKQVWQDWRIDLPPFAESRSFYVVGVSMTITNGHLAFWGTISVSVPTDRQVRSEPLLLASKGSTNSPTMEFFLVHNDPIDGGRFIDTERFPKLGYIERTPNLAVRRLQKGRLSERVPLQGQSVTNWSFDMVLNSEDAAKLKDLTVTNISRKLLLMVGNEPVCTASIIAPLLSGSFGLEIQDRSLILPIKKQLEQMEREGHENPAAGR